MLFFIVSYNLIIVNTQKWGVVRNVPLEEVINSHLTAHAFCEFYIFLKSTAVTYNLMTPIIFAIFVKSCVFLGSVLEEKLGQIVSYFRLLFIVKYPE